MALHPPRQLPLPLFAWALVGLTLLSVPVRARAEVPTQSCEDEYGRILKILETNEGFPIERALGDYLVQFGEGSFGRLIASLRRGQVWIDFGAGEARAQLEYLKRLFLTRPKADFPEAIAVGYARPPLRDPSLTSTQRKATRNGSFRYVQGDVLDSIPRTGITHFLVGTDRYGPLSYTKKLSEVFNLYLSLMRDPEARLFVFRKVGQDVIHLRDGTPVLLHEWLQRFPGLEVKVTPSPNEGVHVLEIRLVDPNFRLPILKNLSYKDGVPARRVFQELPLAPN